MRRTRDVWRRTTSKSIAWLKSSYLDTAQQYIELDQKMSHMVFGRDVKHVMLLHLGGFQTVMLPQLIELLKQKGFRLVTLDEAESDPAYQSNPNAGLKSRRHASGADDRSAAPEVSAGAAQADEGIGRRLPVRASGLRA